MTNKHSIIQRHQPEFLHNKPHFSNLIISEAAKQVNVSGLVASTAEGVLVGPGDLAIQMKYIFDNLRKRKWFIAPLTSSLIGSTIDTFLFFSISFYGTGVPWVTLSLGDLTVKIIVALIMLIPFRMLLKTFKPI